MKIKTNLRAGMTFQECDSRRNYLKQAAQSGNCGALGQVVQQPSYPAQLPSPPPVYYPPSQSPSYPAQSQPAAGGGYFGGTFYPDRSGLC
jgi:hypothetical protein